MANLTLCEFPSAKKRNSESWRDIYRCAHTHPGPPLYLHHCSLHPTPSLRFSGPSEFPKCQDPGPLTMFSSLWVRPQHPSSLFNLDPPWSILKVTRWACCPQDWMGNWQHMVTLLKRTKAAEIPACSCETGVCNHGCPSDKAGPWTAKPLAHSHSAGSGGQESPTAACPFLALRSLGGSDEPGLRGVHALVGSPPLPLTHI